MRTRLRWLKLGLLTLWGLMMPSSASAFECTTTDTFDFVSIRWPETPVNYAIRAPGPVTTDLMTALFAIQQSAAAWANPLCTHMIFDDRGVVAAETELRDTNQIIFVDNGWRHDPDAVGLTTMTYSTIDGSIRLGKIEVNEELFRFVDAEVDCIGPTPDAYDLAAVMTHEFGHFIGLAHVAPNTGVPLEGNDAATMSPTVPTCDASFRSLSTDDQDGLCVIYPTGLDPRACDSLPVQAQPYVSNDAFSCRSTSGEGAAPLLLGLLVVLGVSRRRGPKTCSQIRSGR